MYKDLISLLYYEIRKVDTMSERLEDLQTSYRCDYCNKKFPLTYYTTRCPYCNNNYDEQRVQQYMKDYYNLLANHKGLKFSKALENTGNAMQRTGSSMQQTGNSMMGCGCLIIILIIIIMFFS